MAFVQDVTPDLSSRQGLSIAPSGAIASTTSALEGDGSRKSSRARKISKALRVVDTATRAEVAAARLDSLESDVALVPGSTAGAGEGDESDDEEFVFNEKARDGEAQIVKGAKKPKRTTRGAAESRRAVAARTFNAVLEQSFVHQAPKDVPTYLTAAAAPSKAYAPRKFCSVCGFAAPYGCARCGMRFCSKNCSAVHAETRCLKMVGLPNDELCRRRMFRGVYTTPDEPADNQYALYALCEAQMFHKQLPFTASEDGDVKKARMFASADYHLLGTMTAFTNLRALQMYANATLRNAKGYFYIVQINGSKLTDVEDITVEDGDKTSHSARDGDVVLDDRQWGSTPGHGDQVSIHGLVNVEAIDRVWFAERAGEFGFQGAFTDCTPPGYHNMGA